MSDAIDKAIEEIETKIAAKQAEIVQLKKTINGMAAAIGRDAVYGDLDEPVSVSRRGAAIRADEFFGRSPITAVREFLEKNPNEPKSLDEILDALTRGGFDFEAQGWKAAEHRLRNIAISLSKNTSIFVRLPSGPFGLVKWYPEMKHKKAKIESEAREGKNAGAQKASRSAGATPSASSTDAETEDDATASDVDQASNG